MKQRSKNVKRGLQALVYGALLVSVALPLNSVHAKTYDDQSITGTSSDLTEFPGVVSQDITGNGFTYDFTKEPTTVLDNAGPYPIILRGTTATINANTMTINSEEVSNNVSLIQGSKLVMNVKDLYLHSTAMTSVGTGAINVFKGGTGNGSHTELTIIGNVHITPDGAKQSDGTPYKYGFEAKSRNGDVPSVKGSRWMPAAINLNMSDKSFIRIKGLVDMNVYSIGVKTDPYTKDKLGTPDEKLAVIDIKGGNIITPESKTEGFYALANYGGTININYPEIGRGPDPTVPVKIVGNAIVMKNTMPNNDVYYRSGMIRLGLVNDQSSWTGVIDNTGADQSGKFILNLQNGATWTHKAVGKVNGIDKETLLSPSINFYGTYDGVSHVTVLKGGNTEDQAGFIKQEDAAPIDVATYSGYTKVAYEHDNSGTAPTDYKAGGIVIHSVSMISDKAGITLMTPSNNITMSDASQVKQVLNALAGKLTYSDAAANANKLEAKAMIAEGLTSTAKSLSVSPISYKEGTGIGYVPDSESGPKDDSKEVKPVTPKGDTNPESTPKDTTPKDTTPKDTTPKDTTPKDGSKTDVPGTTPGDQTKPGDQTNPGDKTPPKEVETSPVPGTTTEAPSTFTKPINGLTDDVYTQAGVKNKSIYTFTKDTTIESSDPAPLSLKRTPVHIKAGDHSLSFVSNGGGNATGMDVSVQRTSDITAKDVYVTANASSSLSKAIGVSVSNPMKADQNFVINGNLHVNAQASVTLAGISVAGPGKLEVNGNVDMTKADGQPGIHNTMTINPKSFTSGGIVVSGDPRNGLVGGSVTINGDAVLNTDNHGLIAAGAKSSITTKGANITVHGDNQYMPYAAVAVNEGTVNVGDMSESGEGAHDVILNGNIGVLRDASTPNDLKSKKQVTTLSVGLRTPQSKLDGLAVNLFKDSHISKGWTPSLSVAIDNGATWTNERYNIEKTSKGTNLTLLQGALGDRTPGLIIQKDNHDFVVDMLKGKVNFAYETQDGSLTGGDIHIKSAAPSSEVTLLSDGSSVNRQDKAAVKSALSALANKLYYDGYVTGERNLAAKVGLAEGLTSTAQTMSVTPLSFAESNGQGQLGAEETIPEDSLTGAPLPDTHPGTGTVENPSEEHPSTGPVVAPPASGGTEVVPPASGGSQVVPAVGGGSQEVPATGGGSHVVPAVGGGSQEVPAVGGGSEVVPQAGGEHGVAVGPVESAPGETKTVQSLASTAYEQTMIVHLEANNLHKRLGDIHETDMAAGVWARVYGGSFDGNQNNHSYDGNFKAIQVGVDKKVGDQWLVGVAGSYLKSDGSVVHGGSTSNKLTAVAVYGTFKGKNNDYVDIIGKHLGLDTKYDINTPDGLLHGDYHVPGMSLSAEYGRRFDKGAYYVEPQLELGYAHLQGKEYKAKTSLGEHILTAVQDPYDAFTGRLGLRIGKKMAQTDLFAQLDLYRQFSGTMTTHYQATGEEKANVSQSYAATWASLAVGFTHQVNQRAYWYGNFEHSFGGHMHLKWRGDVGVRFSF